MQKSKSQKSLAPQKLTLLVTLPFLSGAVLTRPTVASPVRHFICQLCSKLLGALGL